MREKIMNRTRVVDVKLGHTRWRGSCRNNSGGDARTYVEGLHKRGTKCERKFRLCRWSADWFEAKETGFSGRLSVAPTIYQVAGGAVLLWLRCATPVEDTCGKKGNQLSTP